MKPVKNTLEWTVFGVSLLLIAGVIGVLVYEATTRSSDLPELVIESGRAERTPGGFRIPIRVENEADETAEEVRIEVVLRRGGAEVDRAELTFAYVPRHSRRDGVVTLREDPASGELVLRAVGFNRP